MWLKKIGTWLSDLGKNSTALWVGIAWVGLVTAAAAAGITSAFTGGAAIPWIASAAARLAGNIGVPTTLLWAWARITGKTTEAIADTFSSSKIAA